MKLSRVIRRLLGKDEPVRMKNKYAADCLAVSMRQLGFLNDERFIRAWEQSAEANRGCWGSDEPPDIRWRAHFACWAASHGLNLEGDFVECGVHTGLLSLTICHYLDFPTVPKNFYLFDTFEGIPLETLDDEDKDFAKGVNDLLYFDCWEVAQQNFAPFHNAYLVRGILPDSLEQAPLDRIAYLSIDLNNAVGEIASIEALWDRLVPGAIVLLDDYEWANHESQQIAWNEFAAARGYSIACLPTGQGLLIKR